MLLNESSRMITEQFNFWLATTFALVIASYTAGDKRNRLMRVCVAALYLLACIVFFVRYLDAVQSALYLAEQLDAIGSDYLPGYVGIASFARRVVMVGGALWI